MKEREIEGLKNVLKLIDELTLECPIQDDKECWCKPLEDLKQKIKGDKPLQKSHSVFIERAALCTIEGIRALCGTDKEYSEYVEKVKKEREAN